MFNNNNISLCVGGNLGTKSVQLCFAAPLWRSINLQVIIVYYFLISLKISCVLLLHCDDQLICRHRFHQLISPLRTDVSLTGFWQSSITARTPPSCPLLLGRITTGPPSSHKSYIYAKICSIFTWISSQPHHCSTHHFSFNARPIIRVWQRRWSRSIQYVYSPS